MPDNEGKYLHRPFKKADNQISTVHFDLCVPRMPVFFLTFFDQHLQPLNMHFTLLFWGL